MGMDSIGDVRAFWFTRTMYTVFAAEVAVCYDRRSSMMEVRVW